MDWCKHTKILLLNCEHLSCGKDDTEVVFSGRRSLSFCTSSQLHVGPSATVRKPITLLVAVCSASPSIPPKSPWAHCHLLTLITVAHSNAYTQAYSASSFSPLWPSVSALFGIPPLCLFSQSPISFSPCFNFLVWCQSRRRWRGRAKPEDIPLSFQQPFASVRAEKRQKETKKVLEKEASTKQNERKS